VALNGVAVDSQSSLRHALNNSSLPTQTVKILGARTLSRSNFQRCQKFRISDGPCPRNDCGQRRVR
jgi:hypothetical protein